MATRDEILTHFCRVEEQVKTLRKSLIWPSFWVFWSTAGIALAIHNLIWSTTANTSMSAFSLYVNLFVFVFWGCRLVKILGELSDYKFEKVLLTRRYVHYPSTNEDRDTFRKEHLVKGRNKTHSALTPIKTAPVVKPEPPTVEEILNNVKGYKERA
jgi:hypothetical protein